MTKWQDPRLEAAYDCLDDAMAETHPEHSEYDKFRIARDAIEDADVALERINQINMGLVARLNAMASAACDSDGTRSAETACPAPVPKDCQARAESIAQKVQP